VVFFAKVISYPNPFKKVRASDRLTISYFPSDAAEAQDQFPDFHIAIYTMAGELVRVLDREDKGEIARLERKAFWDGKNDDGRDAAAGMYWYVLEGSLGRNKGHFTFIH
jgi:flagellar hook assembly protein FlgD